MIHRLVSRRRRDMSRRRFGVWSVVPWLTMSVVGLVVLAAGVVDSATSASGTNELNTDGGSSVGVVERPHSPPGGPHPAVADPARTQSNAGAVNPAIGSRQVDNARLPRRSALTPVGPSRNGTQAAPHPELAPPSSHVPAQPAIPVAITLNPSRPPIPMVPIGVSPAGILEPPSNINTAGWWVGGPRPGAPGRAVITGHIDSTAGIGAFAALADLHVGDHVELTESAGVPRRYRVTNQQEIEKTHLDPNLLTHTRNASDILLVTCIGTFDYAALSYESNLLITAVPDDR